MLLKKASRFCGWLFCMSACCICARRRNSRVIRRNSTAIGRNSLVIRRNSTAIGRNSTRIRRNSPFPRKPEEASHSPRRMATKDEDQVHQSGCVGIRV
ncbi:hypothetical protein EEX84_04890 [Planococcus salinus]|uniref:Uncharacterized protein n=1 Tax=Planococcus salinus TaxID=1848460 RepID=A0A3M8P974_9BACL|nr:hypothetical protein EEX84_04890 [Planococcus salinus]